MLPKLYIGPVSKNTINSVRKISNLHNIKLGLIPSRRQVDTFGGYIGYNTSELYDLLKNDQNIILERDHGGPSQGQEVDDGVASLINDAKYFKILHVDPFKYYTNIKDAAENTCLHIKYLFNQNRNIKFEVGTEEGIRPYTIKELKNFVNILEKSLSSNEFESILYLVVQGGTKVREGKNLGMSDLDKLFKFVEFVNSRGKLSKEHNGDYLDISEIKLKFQTGLSALNIAPEFGSIESEVISKSMDCDDKEKFYTLVLNSKKWVKWFSKDFNPENNKDVLLKMCGHYVFEESEFKILKTKYNLDSIIIDSISNKILESVL